MDKKTLPKIEVTVEVSLPTGLSTKQIADLKKRLKSAIVQSYPERLKPEQVTVQNKFRIWSPLSRKSGK